MYNSHSLGSRWLVVLIITIVLAVVLVCALAALVYFITTRTTRLFKNIPPAQDGQLSRGTAENSQINSPVEMEPDRIYLGIDDSRRLPFLTTIESSIKSAHPSVYHQGSSGSNQPSNPSSRSRTLLSSETGHKVPRTVSDLKTLLEVSEGSNAPKVANMSDKSSNYKTDHVSSDTSGIMRLKPPCLPENDIIRQKGGSNYSPFYEEMGGLDSLPKTPSGEIDAPSSSAGSTGEFCLTMANNHPVQSFEKFPELRVVPSAIVETTEKKKPTQVLRKKLLSLVFTPSTQRLVNVLEEKEVKYYWEMMQVESSETWWQLPFPPQLSPIEATFKDVEPGQ